jgi:hypothetical protein
MHDVPLSLLTKRELAHHVLDEMFAKTPNNRILIAEAVTAAQARGVCYRTLRRVAAEDYKVTTIRQGSAAGIWERS